MNLDRLKAVPPWGWIALAALGGVAFLCWHQFANDDQDPDWTSPKETQAPIVAPFPMTPGPHGSGAPMACNQGFKTRSYPGSLVEADFSIIGEC